MLVEQVLEEALRRVQEIPRNQKMLRVAIFGLLDGIAVQRN
jgi:hypothetical protein